MKNRLLGMFSLVGGLIYLYADFRLPKPHLGDPLGPRIFPAIIGVGILASGAMLLVERGKRKLPEGHDAEGQEPNLSRPVQQLSYVILIGMVAWTAIYYFFFQRLGYIVATCAYLFPMLCYFNAGRWIANISIAVVFAIVSYSIFDKVLGVTLPIGLIGF
jgi:putative tricarboxylic transport membrane protein